MKPDRAQTFPMRVVTRMTGLTADVVRVWERRYGAITPARTEGNARRYSSHDIERLTRLRDAIAAGHSIGDIANLADARLTALAASRDAITETRPILAPYLEAMSELDLPRGEALLARASQLLGPRAMVLDVVLPLLREVGDRYAAGSLTVAEEHAVSAQIRAHLAILLRTTVLPAGAPRMVFGTPPGHRHELGAMMAAVLASARGVSPIYLGPDVPFEEVEGACVRSRAAVAVLSVLIVHESAVDRRRELRATEKLAERIETWVGAPPGHPLLRAIGIRPMTDFGALEAALTHRLGIAGSWAQG